VFRQQTNLEAVVSNPVGEEGGGRSNPAGKESDGVQADRAAEEMVSS
jgi:hypothetical protein